MAEELKALEPIVTGKPRRKGRGYIKIDWARVDDMLKAMCDGTDIAAALGVSEDTLYRAARREKGMQWGDYAAAQFANTRALLRQTQLNKATGYKRVESVPFNTAEGVVFHQVTKFYEPDTNMLKFLGVQYLGQAEKQDVKLQIENYRIVGDDEESADEEI
ncbi:hypothetical protein GCM10023189_43290 [Nibrella saemangeumensis]|uniref:Uncharacterized protein n=1 Tax=Nibrella saemangeumensis TaxID=1084526 RepID=A0ABP8NAV2_9BACT